MTAPDPYVGARTPSGTPKTNADYQREHRQRQADRLATLEGENVTLRTELDATRAELDNALEEIEQLTTAQCKHPLGGLPRGTVNVVASLEDAAAVLGECPINGVTGHVG